VKLCLLGGLAWIKKLFIILIYTWLVCLDFSMLMVANWDRGGGGIAPSCPYVAQPLAKKLVLKSYIYIKASSCTIFFLNIHFQINNN